MKEKLCPFFQKPCLKKKCIAYAENRYPISATIDRVEGFCTALDGIVVYQTKEELRDSHSKSKEKIDQN